MKIKTLCKYLESFAPLSYQESYDNSGLLVGDAETEIKGVLIALDCTEDVVDEAIAKGYNLIIAHHPIVFKGLKRFTGRTYVERTVMKAIRHDIALYAIHTNLDHVAGGVNFKIAEKLGLTYPAILSPKEDTLRKLAVFVPRSHVEEIRTALFSAGAGKLGDYEECSYNTAGYGTFTPLEPANPTLGTIGQQERVEETRVEVIYPEHLERNIIVSMLAAHPYEEVAYDIIPIKNSNNNVGAGAIGNLVQAMPASDFLSYLKDKLELKVIRHTRLSEKIIQRVAVCGGSGGFLLSEAKRSGADIFITADYTYHGFFDAEDQTIIADIGHFESEQFTQELLADRIRNNHPHLDIPIQLTTVNTNPVQYFV